MARDARSLSSAALGKSQSSSTSRESGVTTKAEPGTGGTSAGGAIAPARGSSAGAPPASVPAPQDSSTTFKRPEIRSFGYLVEPYVPLSTAAPDGSPRAGRPPLPPSILSIVQEGTTVKAGDVVCELDSSAFRVELLAQKVRYLQAKARVVAARSTLEVNQLALREYQDGVLPQDLGLIRRHIRTCETGRKRAWQNLAWCRAVAAKGLRTQAQVRADTSTLQDAEIALRDAQDMLDRLMKYTGRRIVTQRKARIESIRADMLSLESAFQLEQERLRRIEAMIANCTMRAPRNGIVVYANRSNSSGMITMQIRPGVTVYESQPIFRVVDPRHLHIRARINETQVAWVKSDQPALIRIDAFPKRVLRGAVRKITPIAELAGGSVSDVRAYAATIRIDWGGWEGLRAGLSAKVEIQVATRHRVTRVPLEAIRWCDTQPFAAVTIPATNGSAWRWQRLALGASDTTFAEVISGVQPGDSVISSCQDLPAPESGVAPGLGSRLSVERRQAT
jgi:multidrug resistance efflux pump